MAVTYCLGLLFLVGLAQAASVVGHDPAIIETMRSVAGSRVVGGWEAVTGQIPHQVSVRMVGAAGGVSSCGGSIVHHNWVITAAHCVANRLTFVVRFGLTNLTQPLYIVETERKYIHPEYIEALGGVQPHDIALLGIDQDIPYGPTIQPIRMQNSQTMNDDYSGVVLTVSGYGMTDDSWNGGTTSEVLRWTFLRGISNVECLNWYSSRVIVDSTICAEYYNDTAQSSCQGDSGGPLTFVDVDGRPTMIGVVSFGSSAGCNSPWPSAYVRPGHYHEWYEEVTGINFDWSNEDIASGSNEDSAPEEGSSSNSSEESSSNSSDNSSSNSSENSSSNSSENSSSNSSENSSSNSSENSSSNSSENSSSNSSENSSSASNEDESGEVNPTEVKVA